jgi:hypothetical protein
MLNSRPFSRNETVYRPFMTRTSPVTPYGLASVTLTSLMEIPGCNIETFEPVSKIRLLDMPSIRTEINGVPHSNAILTGGLLTAFSETGGRSCLHSRLVSRNSGLPFLFPPSSNGGFSLEKRGRLGASPGSLYLGESALLASLLSRVGHSLAKCPTPSHS